MCQVLFRAPGLHSEHTKGLCPAGIYTAAGEAGSKHLKFCAMLEGEKCEERVGWPGQGRGMGEEVSLRG